MAHIPSISRTLIRDTGVLHRPTTEPKAASCKLHCTGHAWLTARTSKSDYFICLLKAFIAPSIAQGHLRAFHKFISYTCRIKKHLTLKKQYTKQKNMFKNLKIVLSVLPLCPINQNTQEVKRTLFNQD